ncbi:hypothetical protein [Agromyces sp. H66]|uniref:hypothetical protein n=1 Tax=Agromyces sp. H66 TaxID=2529859 RepID=UPI0010AB3DEE|nr:hypothetical protein [Agromyces sp. H66]
MSAPDPNEPGGLGERLKRAADAATPSPIDVDVMLRRSRAARRTRRTALVRGAGAVVGVLAVAGLAFGLQGIAGPSATDGQLALESDESGGMTPEAAEDGASEEATGPRLPAPYEVNRCGAPVAPPTDAAASPLAVAVAPPPGAVPPGTSATVTITVTNLGDDVVSGTLAADPPVTVASAGITVWHSDPVGDAAAIPVTLAPGASVSLETVLETRSCTEADDAGGSLPPDLPALAPGEYGLGVVVSFTDPDGAATVHLVSPLAPFAVG